MPVSCSPCLSATFLNSSVSSKTSSVGFPLTPNLNVFKALIGELFTISNKVSLSTGIFSSIAIFKNPDSGLPSLSNFIILSSSNSSAVTLRETPVNGPELTLSCGLFAFPNHLIHSSAGAESNCASLILSNVAEPTIGLFCE